MQSCSTGESCLACTVALKLVLRVIIFQPAQDRVMWPRPSLPASLLSYLVCFLLMMLSWMHTKVFFTICLQCAIPSSALPATQYWCRAAWRSAAEDPSALAKFARGMREADDLACVFTLAHAEGKLGSPWLLRNNWNHQYIISICLLLNSKHRIVWATKEKRKESLSQLKPGQGFMTWGRHELSLLVCLRAGHALETYLKRSKGKPEGTKTKCTTQREIEYFHQPLPVFRTLLTKWRSLILNQGIISR